MAGSGAVKKKMVFSRGLKVGAGGGSDCHCLGQGCTSCSQCSGGANCSDRPSALRRTVGVGVKGMTVQRKKAR